VGVLNILGSDKLRMLDPAFPVGNVFVAEKVGYR